MQSPNGYSALQIRLHWVVAALIVLQYLGNAPISDAWDAYVAGTTLKFNPLVAAHVAGGLLILLLVGWRLVVRVTRGVPPPPEQEALPLRILAKLTHGLLYAILIAMPVTGAVAWFGGVGQAASAHNVIKVALVFLVGLHVVGALVHHFIFKSNVLIRMWRPQA